MSFCGIFITAHPAIQGVQQMRMNWGESLAVSGDRAMALIRTDRDTWCDTNFNNTKDAADATGPFVVAAAVNTGQGRVVAVADNAFQDDGLQSNMPVLRAFLRWTTRYRTDLLCARP